PLDVDIISDADPSPPSLPPLAAIRTRRSARASRTSRIRPESAGASEDTAIPGLHYVGIEVQPVYRQARTGTPYPVLFETLRSGLSLALRQSAYHFAMLHTGHE